MIQLVTVPQPAQHQRDRRRSRRFLNYADSPVAELSAACCRTIQTRHGPVGEWKWPFLISNTSRLTRNAEADAQRAIGHDAFDYMRREDATRH